MVPVLMLTGKGGIEDKEAGLDAGADDYLTKPFHFKELGARLRALLRRPSQMITEELTFRDIVVDPWKRKVTKAGEELQLQPLEYAVLEFFLKHPNDVVGPDGLLNRLWESDAEVSQDAIYSCIRRLRRKLDTDGQPSFLKTIYGIGYTLNT